MDWNIDPNIPQIESLSFPLPDLTFLSLGSFETDEIRLSAATKLEHLELSQVAWKKLILPETECLSVLKCSLYGSINLNLILKRLRWLRELECRRCGINSLDLSNQPELVKLSCRNNKITELTLDPVPKLTKLDCSINEITKLDLSKAPNLTELSCKVNPLKELDIRPLQHLRALEYDSKKTRLIQRQDQSF